MNISFIKFKKDKKSFNFVKGFGAKVFELEDPENIDNLINQLTHEKYDTIIITNEVAGFSSDIIKKYKRKENVNIVIIPSK